MFIITTDQLRLCEAIRRSHSQAEHLFVYAYQEWLFVKGEVYSYQEKHSAIAHTQSKLESGIMCILVVDEQDNYIAILNHL